MLKTESIKKFLEAKTHADLAILYNPNMEVQVLVAQDKGERTDKSFKGKNYQTYDNGDYSWSSFRVPRNANTDPEYVDTDLQWPIEKHAEGVGLTGWDWKNKVSKWVAYDFDAIVGHSDSHQKKMSAQDLEVIRQAVSDVPWVSIRTSTSGNGLHLYVFLDDIQTENHTEHAALARWILSQLSGIVGHNLLDKVDVCGHILWFWHRKLRIEDGLKLIKEGTTLEEVDSSWRNHVPVIQKKSSKPVPQEIIENESNRLFEEAIGQGVQIALDAEHKKLIAFLTDQGYKWSWDADNHLLVTHTYCLKQAHEHLRLQGVFETLSTGTDAPNDHNCFCYPLRKGAWSVRRFSIGCTEHNVWQQDSSGWTKCILNNPCSFEIACRFKDGREKPNGSFAFQHCDQATEAARLLGVSIESPTKLSLRPANLKISKGTKLIIEVQKEDFDTSEELEEWVTEGKFWKRVYQIKTKNTVDLDIPTFEDVIRHVLDENRIDQGWLIKTRGDWSTEPVGNVRLSLQAQGLKGSEVTVILGTSVNAPWVLVNRPFQDEYVGDRQWNRSAAQLRFTPEPNLDDLEFASWQSILDHCGASLSPYVEIHPWCHLNGIRTGADYLHIWLASLIQHPGEPLPYLFFHGPQNSGKSTFHEAVSLLMTSGVRRADNALVDTRFNAELAGAVLCVIEETDLNRNKQAYNKVKDWVTSQTISIHEKGRTPIEQRNYTHWVQVANEADACPIFPGDTRITVMYVGEMDLIDMIPRRRLFGMLEKQAPAFLSSLLNLPIPECNDRLRVPVIESVDKSTMQNKNKSMLEDFIEQEIFFVDNALMPFDEFYARFIKWLDDDQLPYWSKTKVAKQIPVKYPSGKHMKDKGRKYVVNMAWSVVNSPLPKVNLEQREGYVAIIT